MNSPLTGAFVFAAFCAVLYVFGKPKQMRWWVLVAAIASLFIAQGFLTFVAVLIAIVGKVDESKTFLAKQSRLAKMGGVIALIVMVCIYSYVQNLRRENKDDFLAPLAESLVQGEPEKRRIDDRLSIVAPVNFERDESPALTAAPEQARRLVAADDAWIAKFSGTELNVEKIQFWRTTPGLKDTLMGMIQGQLGQSPPIEWFQPSEDSQAGRIIYTYEDQGKQTQVALAAILSGQTIWMIVGTGETAEAQQAAADAVRSLTFK
jgi:hypothetical protein